MCFPRNSISETEVIDQTPSGCSIMCKLLLKAERLQGRWCVLIADTGKGRGGKSKKNEGGWGERKASVMKQENIPPKPEQCFCNVN